VPGCSAAFSPAPDGRAQLPFDPVTAVLVPGLWQRWLDWDPVRMVPGHAEALRSLHSVWIDAGKRDDFSLDLGAQAFHRALLGHDVPADRIRFELFEAGHGGIRLPLPAVARLAGPGDVPLSAGSVLRP
jgi:hypothetical protein